MATERGCKSCAHCGFDMDMDLFCMSYTITGVNALATAGQSKETKIREKA